MPMVYPLYIYGGCSGSDDNGSDGDDNGGGGGGGGGFARVFITPVVCVTQLKIFSLYFCDSSTIAIYLPREKTMSGYRKVNYYELCRLCTSSEGNKMNIFRDEGRRRQLQTKIQTYLPIQVSIHASI